jgi:membrane peptidoglycan carboxypeptidase
MFRSMARVVPGTIHWQSFRALARAFTAIAFTGTVPGRTKVRILARSRRPLRPLLMGWAVTVLALGLLATVAYHEMRTSALQSFFLSRYVARLSYPVEPGASPAIAVPEGGPFDRHRGYSVIPEFQGRLAARGYHVVEQARQSPELIQLVSWGVTPPYPASPVAGLVIRDTQGTILHDARPRAGFYRRFEDVPPLVVNTLLFIENRELGRAANPRANLAVDWPRLAKASMLYAGSKVGLAGHVEGGSTLATQLQKYRHSPDGRTDSPVEKIRQMAGASLKVYQGGPDTRAQRRQIVVDYLNTMPLSGVPGVGEVSGLGEGLRGWFGLELEGVTRALAAPGARVEKARAFKHVLALIYAVRAPTYYLQENRAALEQRIGSYASLLLAAGVLDADLHRQLASTRLRFAEPVVPGPPTFIGRKATNAVREELRQGLGVAGYYQLDRLDLAVDTTVDAALQETAIRLFRALEDPLFVQARGLRAERMLAQADPRRVIYSLSLFERTPGGNVLRVLADNLDKPFDMNEGMKLELGSTAKLRTAAHYLELVAELHRDLSGRDTAALARLAAEARDPLTRWAAESLGRQPRLDLEGLLRQALERKYSASPHEVFFTGGGVHTFGNFEPRVENTLVLSVSQALVRSSNLVYIRLMRDLARYHENRLSYDARAILADPANPERRRMLDEIAEEESRQALARAYRDYHTRDADGAVSRLVRGKTASARELAKVFYAWHPGANPDALEQWLAARLDGVKPEEVQRLAKAYGNPRLTLADHGYLLGRHPLEVWVAAELVRSPGLSWDQVLARSEAVRRVSSAWLFQPRNRRAQDLRLRIRIERDAFARMTPYWRRLGFPFERLVPSYATAIGSSSDRPAALAELMGIVLDDGVRRPARTVSRVALATGTPYHTVMEPTRLAGEQVLPVPVARALRGVLVDVVDKGTAQRLRGVFVGAGDVPALVGAKTGSGDNRFETYARGGGVISSRVVSRTGTVVFFIGDRYYGALTASVSGKTAGSYQFTSALPVAVLKLLAPQLNSRLGVGMPAPGPIAALPGIATP